jgi:hypothetical protein
VTAEGRSTRSLLRPGRDLPRWQAGCPTRRAYSRGRTAHRGCPAHRGRPHAPASPTMAVLPGRHGRRSLLRWERGNSGWVGADLHGATGVHRTPGRNVFLCNLAIFHHVCTPKKMIFMSCDTHVHPVVECSSSATG